MSEQVVVKFVGGPWNGIVRALPALVMYVHGTMVNGRPDSTRWMTEFSYKRRTQLPDGYWLYTFEEPAP